MRNPVRLNTLAVLVAASLGGGLATPVAWSQVTVSDAPTASPAASEHALYMIYFGEPGALEYRGGVGNLEGAVANAGLICDELIAAVSSIEQGRAA